MRTSARRALTTSTMNLLPNSPLTMLNPRSSDGFDADQTDAEDEEYGASCEDDRDLLHRIWN